MIEIVPKNSTALLQKSEFPYLMSRVQNKRCELSVRPAVSNKKWNSNVVGQLMSDTV